MRAAVLRGQEDLRIEDVPIPTAAPGELVLRVGAALTCGTDLKVYRRGYHAKMLTLDRLFGHEVAGTVVQVGAGVTRFSVGDRVLPLNSAPCDTCFFCRNNQQNLCDDLLFNNGAYAEFIRIPSRIVEKNTLHIPNAVAPAFVFDPVPGGTVLETTRKPANLGPVPHVSAGLAGDSEALAFATVRELGELIRAR